MTLPSSSPVSSLRFTTGSDALDQVLGGGLPAGSMSILAGLPGTGKTILAEQILFANASADRPALYLTTLSEPLDKTIRYLQAFSFYDARRLPGPLRFLDIGQTVREQGVESLPKLVEDLLIESGAAFVVIDSFKALHDLSIDHIAFRTALFDLARVLAAAGVTALLLGEYAPADIAEMPEFAVADGVIELTNRSHGVRDERTLRVHKLRGAAPLPGEHSFRIGTNGLTVFPRLMGGDTRLAALSTERVATGIPGLDPLLGGGVWGGSSTLVAGPSGVGKTLLGLRFLLAGAEHGEPGLLLSFQESPAHLRRNVAGFGFDLDGLERQGLLRVLYVSPLELDLVELFTLISHSLETDGARRVVVDPIDDMREAAIDRTRFRAAAWSLVQHFALGGVTGMLLLETPLTQEGAGPASQEISYMADNVLLLRYLRPPVGGFDRAIEVLKTRGSAHDPHLHGYRMGSRGPEVDAPSLEARRAVGHP